MVSPGSYTETVVLSISHTLQTAGEFVNLTSTAPAGITVAFSPASPVPVPATKSLNVTMIITASVNTALGNGTVGIQAVAGPYNRSISFPIQVVQYRVVIIKNSFLPSDLNVTVGSTVYWQNLDGPAGGCGEVGGTGLHNIVFTTLPQANSSTIKQFGIHSYTFLTPGSYFYYSSLDTDHVVNGTINVQASGGGGMGMVSRMPSFSHFKGGSVATPTTSAQSQNSRAAASPFAVLGLAATGLFVLGLASSVLSSQGLEAGLTVMAALVAFALALALARRGRGRAVGLAAALASRKPSPY